MALYFEVIREKNSKGKECHEMVVGEDKQGRGRKWKGVHSPQAPKKERGVSIMGKKKNQEETEVAQSGGKKRIPKAIKKKVARQQV